MAISRVHMKDQKSRISSGLGVWMIIALIFAVGGIAMMARQAKAEPVQCSITGAEFDNLMSEDAAAFMALNPGEYDEGDLE